MKPVVLAADSQISQIPDTAPGALRLRSSRPSDRGTGRTHEDCLLSVNAWPVLESAQSAANSESAQSPKSAAGEAVSSVSAKSAARVVSVLVLAITLVSTANPLAQQPTRNQHGRLFPPTDLGLLEAPDRYEWQRPDLIMDALGIAEASTVADLGAGSGWFTVQIARRVGPNGLVYAQDVQQLMLVAISRRVQREGLRNVRPVLGTESDPRLPQGTADAVLIADVYHEIDDRVTFLANAAKALKPQGRMGVIDFRLDGGGPGPSRDERVSPDVVTRDAQAAGLRLLRDEQFLPYQYFLIFGRAEPTTDQSAGNTAAAKRTLPKSAKTKG
jgi:ubiquinone/menaquinone biosynthesis C-methylase UbiE